MGAAPLTELIGRSDELSCLTDILDASAAGSGSTVLIGGEAGIGKSRLVAEMSAEAERRGHLVAVGHGSAVDGRNLPYGQLVTLLRDLERRLGPDADGMLSPALDALGLSSVGGGFGTAERPLAGRFARTWLFERMLRALSAVAGHVPTLLVFEDIHWADPGTMGIIDFVCRNVGDARLAVVCTYRSEEPDTSAALESLRTELALLPQVRALDLRGLEGADLTALVGTLLGRSPETRLLAALATRSGGNPFFVQELVSSGSPSDWSTTLRAAVSRRLTGASPEAKRILGVASALSRPMHDQLLRQLCQPGQGDRFDAALRECFDRHLLVVPDRAADEYAFRHELVREAVYDSLLPGERARIHGQVAEALRARANGHDTGVVEAELAGHWWAAGEWEEALRSSVAAADAAREVFAFEEATLYFEHALVCADRLGAASDVDRTALLEQAADAAYFAASGKRSIELARALIEAVDAAAEPQRAAIAYVRLARNQWTEADSSATLEALAAAEALIPDDPPTRELARTLAEKARYLMLTSHFRDSEIVCRRALAVARAAEARSEESHVLATAGVNAGELGHHEEGIEMLKEALAVAQELRSPEDMARAFSNLGSVLFSAGRFEEAADLMQKDPGESDDVAGIRLDNCALNGADAMVELGRWDEAEAAVGLATRHIGNCGSHPMMVRAVIAIRRGRFEDAHRELDAVLRATEKLDDVQFRGEALLRCAELAFAEGEPMLAYDAVEQALSIASSTDDTERVAEMCAVGIRALADMLEQARVRKGRHDKVKLQMLAGELAEQADSRTDRIDESGALGPRALAFIVQCRAELTGLHAPDPEAWARTVAQWKALRHPYRAAYCQWREAEAAGPAVPESWDRRTTPLGLADLRGAGGPAHAGPGRGSGQAGAGRPRCPVGD